MSKKLVLIAGLVGAGFYYANETGLLDPGDEYEDDDFDADPEDLNINNPLALLAISLATQAGLKAASKAVKRVAAPKTKPPSNIVPSAAGAASIKPAPLSKTPVTVEPPAKPKSVVSTPSMPPTNAATSGVKPATPATNAAAAQPPAKPPTAAAKSAAKASNASKMMTKLKGTPADLIVMIIAQILMAVLDLDPSKFMDCETGEFDLGKLPDWAQAMIGAIPFLGDLFDLIGNKMCLKAGCPRDAPDESAGLCYKPCDPGFKSDGAIMCYKQYPEFEGNGMGHTITSITKKILMDTGKVPNRCADGEVKDGALCYNKPDWAASVVAGVAAEGCPGGFTDTGLRCEDVYGGGVGFIPWKKGCGDFPEIKNCRDDGTSLWSDWRCNTWCAGGRDAFGNCWAWDLRTECAGSGSIVKPLWDRNFCPPGTSMRDGLCYEDCRPGYRREGLLCTRSFNKRTEIQAPRELKCPRTARAGVAAGVVEWDEETNIAGLCYGKVPPGYSRKLLGTLDQDCPPGSTDFGVGCTRQAYNRGAGLIPLGIRFKDRLP